MKPGPQPIDRGPGVIECTNAGGLNRIVAFRPASSNRGARPQVRRDHSFGLEPVQRAVNGARHDLAIEPMLHFLENRPAVRFAPGLCSPVHERQQDCLFQGSEVRRQSVYIVDKMTSRSR